MTVSPNVVHEINGSGVDYVRASTCRALSASLFFATRSVPKGYAQTRKLRDNSDPLAVGGQMLHRFAANRVYIHMLIGVLPDIQCESLHIHHYCCNCLSFNAFLCNRFFFGRSNI